KKGIFFAEHLCSQTESIALEMQRTLMVIWILVALTLPGFIHGRPAADDGRSVLSMFTAHASKLEDVLDYEQKPTSLFAQGGSLVPTKL
ncbi:hypothetical protein X777_10029, partial [Ooceraea biroi]